MKRQKKAQKKFGAARAMRKSCKAFLAKKSRARAKTVHAKKPVPAFAAGKIHISKKHIKKFYDPLVVPMPSNWKDSKSCEKILGYRKTQYRLWSWAVALSILLLFSVAAIEILSDMGILAPPGASHLSILQSADFLAIFVIGLELASSFTHSKNKMLFVAENWLAILAILPIGLFARAFKAFEAFAFMEEISILRGFQMAGKFGEFSNIIPALELPIEMKFPALSGTFSGISVSARQFSAALSPLSNPFLLLKNALFRIFR